jgi:glutamate dehydrogenase
MNPVFRVRRGPAGDLQDIRRLSESETAPDGVDETWIHIDLAPSVDPKLVAEAAKLLPGVLADARQVALDGGEMMTTLRNLAHQLDNDPEGRFPGPDRTEVAELLRWLADGHFLLLGYQRCRVQDGRSSVDQSSRLGVLRLRRDLLPELTESDDLLVLAQATIPSYLRYGAYPYIVVVREQGSGAEGNDREKSDSSIAIEHRFVGLFTVAAMNANVLEIPLISQRVDGALAIAEHDPGHPPQLLLDIIQTIPRSACVNWVD